MKEMRGRRMEQTNEGIQRKDKLKTEKGEIFENMAFKKSERNVKDKKSQNTNDDMTTR